MSVQKSQGGSGAGLEKMGFGELCERARLKAAEAEAAAAKEQEKKGKGLDFMAYRMDVARKHLQLSVSRKVTPAEGNLLRFLEIGTIGADNSRRQITAKAEFFIQDLSDALGYKTKMKIWSLLKSLEKKGFIIREKTRSKDREILGLNPKVFTQILIDRHHERDKKRHLSIAVDNTKPAVDNPDPDQNTSQTMHMSTTHESYVEDIQSVCEEQTERLFSESQVPEIRPENLALDSSRSLLDSSRGQIGNKETNVSFGERERIQAEKERQLSEARKLGIL